MLASLGQSRTSGFRLKDLLHSAVIALRRWRDLRQFLAVDDHLDLVSVEDFAFEQSQRNSNQSFVVRSEDALCRFVALANQPLYFLVNLDRRSLAVVAVLGNFASEEDLLFFLAEGQRSKITHAEFADHLAGHFGGSLDVIACAGAHLVQENLLC